MKTILISICLLAFPLVYANEINNNIDTSWDTLIWDHNLDIVGNGNAVENKGSNNNANIQWIQSQPTTTNNTIKSSGNVRIWNGNTSISWENNQVKSEYSGNIWNIWWIPSGVFYLIWILLIWMLWLYINSKLWASWNTKKSKKK